MSDDVERQLDELYRRFGNAARRVQSRWGRARREAPAARAPLLQWVGGGVAAAALALLVVLARGPSAPPQGPGVALDPPARSRPVELPIPRPSDPAPGLRREAPRPSEAPPMPPESRPPGRGPAAQREEPRPAPPVPIRPDPSPPAPTVAGRAVAVLRETEGAFDLGDRPVRGRQKDLRVAAGDRLRAAGVVKLSLAEDRFVLVAPRSVIEFRPEERRIVVSLEQGELLAELAAPGPQVAVAARACEIRPISTVFAVCVEERRATVLVERGRVEVEGPKGKETLRPGEALQLSAEGGLGPRVAADLRTLSWARAHRPPERLLFVEDFRDRGAWAAEVAGGTARGLPAPGVGAQALQLEQSEPPMFEVPCRGHLALVCRADRAARMYVQIYAPEFGVNFRKDVPVLPGSAWRTLAIPFEEFVPVDRAKYSGRLVPGTAIEDLTIVYGEEGDRGNLWVDSIRVVDVRP